MSNKKTKEDLLLEANELLKQLEYKKKYEKFFTYFPLKGAFRQELYPKQMEFFKAGKTHKFRLFMGPNRSGKSFSSQFEFVSHLTGKYMPEWPGHKFDKPITAWAVGVNTDTVKGILQKGLLGEVGEFGSGMIPRKFIDFDTLVDAKKADTGVQKFRVKHVSGGWSTVEFKSYESGRRAFEGTAIDLILLDEEPPLDIYTECVLRTMTTNGLIIMNFTPLLGMTKTIETFCGSSDWTEGEKGPGRYLVHLDSQNVPHLTKEMRETMLANIPEYQRDARLRGIPQLGAGAVYPYPEELVFVDDFDIPKTWKRFYAMDFGWTKPTAILWGAIRPDDQCVFFYSEHYWKEKEPMFHANAIKRRNEACGYKIPGCCDPSGGGRGIHDGDQAREIYHKEFDIIMEPANNSIEPGIMKVNEWLSSGRIKFFKSLTNLKSEYRMYRRNEKGVPVGEDHLMDCLKYGILTGFDIANNTNAVTADDWEKAREAAWAEDNWNQFGNKQDAWLYR